MSRIGFLVGWLITPWVSAQPESTRVIFYPDWFPSAQFAGVYVALDRGYYTAAGLEVELREFAYGQNATANLAADPATCTLGTIEGYILLQHLDRGDDLVAFRPMLRESPAGVMSFARAQIQSAADFAGRPVGVHAYADKLFAWFAANAGLAPTDTHFVRVEDDVADLISGTVQAMQGYATEEYVAFQARVAPTPTAFLSFRAMGFPSYSEILYTTRAHYRRHPQTLRRFIDATRRGWAEVYRDPPAAVAAILARLPPDAEADPAHTSAALTALRPYVFGAASPPLAPMDPARWNTLIDVAREMTLISGDIPPPAKWLR